MIDGATVLVADDNDGIRSTTAMILKSVGCDVVEAVDGNAALEELRSRQVDVAVLDVRMPGRDGISVVEDLYPHPPPPGVVMASAYEIDRDVRTRLGGRVLRYMRKPVPPNELIEAVGEAAEIAKAAQV